MKAATVFFGVVSALALLACLAGLTPADEAQIAKVSVTVAYCESVGRACKADGGTGCYGQYDACMREGGLRD